MAKQKDQGNQDAELAQISFYLAKQDRTFETVFDKERLAELTKQPKYLSHTFKVDGKECQFTYFETASSRKNPPWLDFANEQLPVASRISFASKGNSPNGILLLTINKRIFVATFGRSAVSFLQKRAFEPDFGIKVAMNLCGNEEVRQTKSASNTITTTFIDRQTNRPTDTFAFGLGDAEDLRFISAHMKGTPNVTLQGRETITMKVVGDDKIDWQKLVAACENFLNSYGSKAYEKLFPNYKNFRLADDSEAEELDKKLLAALKAEDFKVITLGIPEFLSDNDYSYSYTNHAQRENVLYAYLDIMQLKSEIKLDKLTIQSLKAKSIYAYSPIEDRILAHMSWDLYDCLTFEAKLGDAYFVLSAGNWSEVDKQFYKDIEKFIATVRVEPAEPDCVNIDIADHKKKKNREYIFNREYCGKRRESVHFDTAKLKIGSGTSNKEFCDILDITDDGVIRIINCKPYKDASGINYLFSQAKFYSHAFLTDEVFLKDIREHIAKSTSTKKKDYLAIIPDDLGKNRGENFRICLWLLYDNAAAAPKKEEIPLISKFELKLMHDHLLRICKFREIVLRFIPVKITNFKTAKRPKKVAVVV